MRVTVDGVDYIPAGGPNIGVAITTKDRPHVLAETLAAFTKHSPNIPVVVVDDGSQVPVDNAVRHPESLGVARSKNRCIAELMRLKVEHLFLFDDDTRPVCDRWWEPYVNSPESHLQFSWTHFGNGKPVTNMDVLYQDSGLVAHGWSMGCMLYVTSRVIDRVGGMNPAFVSMHEHIEFSRRIHQAGLSTFVHQDVPESGNLFWAGDRTGEVKSSIADRKPLLDRNDQLLAELDGNTDFVPYTERDVVLTCLFTGHGDPQRRTPMPANPKLADTLLNTLNGETVVLCDFDTDHPNFVKVAANLNPYIQRWISYRRYLLENPDIRFVWCVDATDVECLRNPFPMMQPATLYCGWENQIVGCQWMRDHHPSSKAWIDTNHDRTLLNAGVVGGDRNTILTLTERILRLWTESTKQDLADMGFFNQAAYTLNPVTGPRITTLFKANQRNDFSLFRHK